MGTKKVVVVLEVNDEQPQRYICDLLADVFARRQDVMTMLRSRGKVDRIHVLGPSEVDIVRGSLNDTAMLHESALSNDVDEETHANVQNQILGVTNILTILGGDGT